jgi:hypothetical protein
MDTAQVRIEPAERDKHLEAIRQTLAYMRVSIERLGAHAVLAGDDDLVEFIRQIDGNAQRTLRYVQRVQGEAEAS